MEPVKKDQLLLKISPIYCWPRGPDSFSHSYFWGKPYPDSQNSCGLVGIIPCTLRHLEENEELVCCSTDRTKVAFPPPQSKTQRLTEPSSSESWHKLYHGDWGVQSMSWKIPSVTPSERGEPPPPVCQSRGTTTDVHELLQRCINEDRPKTSRALRCPGFSTTRWSPQLRFAAKEFPLCRLVLCILSSTHLAKEKKQLSKQLSSSLQKAIQADWHLSHPVNGSPGSWQTWGSRWGWEILPLVLRSSALPPPNPTPNPTSHHHHPSMWTKWSKLST